MRDRGRWLFAEFVVVGLGVLAALGVDALVTRVNEAARAQEYRERLAVDLRNDAAFIADRAAWHERLIAYGEITRRILHGAPTGRPVDEEFLAVFMASNDHRFSSSASTWEDIVNTGGLGLFDLETRSLLSDYYTALPADPVTWELPDEYRNRIRRLTRPDQISAMDHAACAFRGLFDDRRDSQLPADPTPQDCRTSLDAGEARQLLEDFRSMVGIEGDLNLRLATALLIVQTSANWVDRALELADYLDSL